ncbi:MAG: 4Fe-4S dicluster domain-containing protein [Desulfofustis sp.]|nr:4Fe-4S dicluster domain-containing protein [Desulfofustis sp.]
MKFDGGYNVLLEGEPATDIASYQKPEALHLPLFSKSLDFSLLLVEHGEEVTKGQILAEDPVNFSVPLLAPMDGTVNLELVERHVTLENLSSTKDSEVAHEDDENKRQILLRLGVWSSLARVDTGRIPDPENTPDCLVIPVSRLEPFFPVAGTLLKDALEQFGGGLDLFHKLFEEAEILLICAESDTDIKTQLQTVLTERANWLKLFEVPDLYPFDSPALAALLNDLNSEKTWTTDLQAVLAARAAIDDNHPFIKRVISVSGPMATTPGHHLLPIGFPLANLGFRNGSVPLRVINGGVLTGSAVDDIQLGIDCSCQALNVLEEMTEREVLAFVQPGLTKRSYSNTFASFFKPIFKEKSTTALGGEARPCVFCGFCESVCPVGIIPHVIYRYLDHNRPEDAYRVEFDKCIDCGLCSYVCVSKINHLELFRAERQRAITEILEG